MSNQNILKYVDQVICKANIPAEYKTEVENNLIRNILTSSDQLGADEVINTLASPEKLAEELTKKFESEAAARSGRYENAYEDYKPRPPYPPHPPHPRYSGEFMQERSNVNLKLLYIPLLQISSGTQRLTMPLLDGC